MEYKIIALEHQVIEARKAAAQMILALLDDCPDAAARDSLIRTLRHASKQLSPVAERICNMVVFEHEQRVYKRT